MRKICMRWANNRAISTIIAVILMLLITVAIAGGTFFWISATQRQVQAGISEQTEDVQRNIRTEPRIFVSEYDNSTEKLQIYISSAGGGSFSVIPGSTTFVLKYVNGTVKCVTTINNLGQSTTFTIASGIVSTFNLSFDSTACDIGTTRSNIQFLYDLNFGGEFIAAGAFNF